MDCNFSFVRTFSDWHVAPFPSSVDFTRNLVLFFLRVIKLTYLAACFWFRTEFGSINEIEGAEHGPTDELHGQPKTSDGCENSPQRREDQDQPCKQPDYAEACPRSRQRTQDQQKLDAYKQHIVQEVCDFVPKDSLTRDFCLAFLEFL